MKIFFGIFALCLSFHAAADDYPGQMAREHAQDSSAASPAAKAAPEQAVSGSEVLYGEIEGKPARGYLAFPLGAGSALPGIIVFHEWWGLNDNVRAMTRQLAAQGYAALAVDLYGSAAQSPEEARGLMQAALKNEAALAAHFKAAMNFLRGPLKAKKVAALGWCFGGGMALEAALQLPDQVTATVIYYGHLTADEERLKPLTMPVLGLFGDEDQGIPVSDVRAFEATLKKLGRDPEIHVYAGAGHAFANPSGKRYQAAAAEDAWQRTRRFLAEHLKRQR